MTVLSRLPDPDISPLPLDEATSLDDNDLAAATEAATRFGRATMALQLTVGAALTHRRNTMTKAQWIRWLHDFADQVQRSERSLWRWMQAAQQHYGLAAKGARNDRGLKRSDVEAALHSHDSPTPHPVEALPNKTTPHIDTDDPHRHTRSVSTEPIRTDTASATTPPRTVTTQPTNQATPPNGPGGIDRSLVSICGRDGGLLKYLDALVLAPEEWRELEVYCGLRREASLAGLRCDPWRSRFDRAAGRVVDGGLAS